MFVRNSFFEFMHSETRLSDKWWLCRRPFCCLCLLNTCNLSHTIYINIDVYERLNLFLLVLVVFWAVLSVYVASLIRQYFWYVQNCFSFMEGSLFFVFIEEYVFTNVWLIQAVGYFSFSIFISLHYIILTYIYLWADDKYFIIVS